MVDDGRSSSPLPRSILYVDPDTADRRRIVRALESGGDAATVEGAASAADLRDALAAESSEYACVVTEYRLGETDAVALYDSLRADGRETVPVVLYTADGDEALASDAIAAGFSGYAPKGGDDSVDRLRAQLRTVSGGDDASDGRHRSRDRDLERYRTLVETVGDSMYVVDADGTIEMANEAMAEALDEPREALLGTHVTEFLSVDDARRVQETLEEIHSSDDRAWGTVEITVELADGERCDAEVNVASLTDADGRITGSVGAIRDISARAERERRFRRLHDGTRRLMAATEAEEIARTVSEIACDALDLRLNSVYLYESDVVVRSAADASSGGGTDGPAPEDETDGAASGDEPNGSADADDPSATAEEDGGGLVAAAMSDRAAELFGDVGFIEPDGGIVWDAFEAGEAIVHGDVRRAPNVRNPETAVRSEAHIPLGDHGILIVSSLEPNAFDPSALTLARILAANAEAALDRAERERELADRSREFERQNERLEAFASTVSHDLRNPLTLAMGHLEALAELLDGDADADGHANADDHPDADADDYADVDDHLEEIDWVLERMDELVENVLTLARSGQQLTETEPVDLAEVAECAHRMVDPALDVRWDDSLPTVDGDDARLRVLFENAFRNADEHAGADATVTVEPTPEGFAIDDDGPGIAPDEREHVLEWGYSTATDGTGFGLAIVAEVVEAHGWRIEVAESEAGGLRLAVAVGDSRSRLE
ncbi:PAS domain S-box protein [Haloterrigena alkaliphila]|uniref:histidine kinase n=1 Tax=Haloterrigena alkaliphila TaxID=2816475 RepID=A0A8A2VDN3_9EURY|nr:PAS domain S-box protein [Haloterrigena alkaliphila]QSX00184.1 PAS domain S-box protein [Haloterrigena alkaliphila]